MRDENRIPVAKVIDDTGTIRPLRVNPITGRLLCTEGTPTASPTLPPLNARRDGNRVVALLVNSPSGPVPVQVNPNGHLVCNPN